MSENKKQDNQVEETTKQTSNKVLDNLKEKATEVKNKITSEETKEKLKGAVDTAKETLTKENLSKAVDTVKESLNEENREETVKKIKGNSIFKIVALGVLVVVCLLVLKSCFTPKVSGENFVDGYTGGPDVVNVYPKCPECDHVYPLYSINLSSGEDFETTFICDGCGEIFDVIVERK